MFSEKTLEFLGVNRAINNKQWFVEHKSEYTEYVLAPLAGLAACLAPTISEIDNMIITEPKVDLVISRIYRDMRYVRDDFFIRAEALAWEKENLNLSCRGRGYAASLKRSLARNFP